MSGALRDGEDLADVMTRVTMILAIALLNKEAYRVLHTGR